MKKIVLLLLVLLQTSHSFSQDKLAVYEDSLKNLGEIVLGDSVQTNRVEANDKFIKTFVEALKQKNSFYYPFNNLKDFVTIKSADDNKFRIFTWFNRFQDGTYRYFGAIQINNPDRLELYPLLDNTEDLKKATDVETLALDNKEWFGAVYYQIITVPDAKNPYFILLGWKGKTPQSSSKVIETLKFIDGKPAFGTDVLESKAKSKAFVKRLVFDYTKDASMLLRYVKADNRIVFDHLVAPNQKTEGQKNLYAPDLSYDALILKQGKWLIQENLKLTNLPNDNDGLFIDPAKDGQNTAPAINN